MGALRKILTTGVGAALMTEGRIRNAVSDINVTRQAKDYLTRQAQKGKEEFAKVVVGELKGFLSQVDLHEEIRKALTGLTVEVQARLRIIPSDASRDHLKIRVRKKKRGV